MTDFIISILPIFLILVLGQLLRRDVLANEDFWSYADKLVFWVLVPCLLFFKISTIEVSAALVGTYAMVILGAYICALVFAIIAGAAGRMPTGVTSSLIQGCARHNPYIAFAIAEPVFGAHGLTLAALATAILLPFTNLTLVPLIVSMHRKPGGKGILHAVMSDIARNPILIAVGLGFAVNFSGIGWIPVLHEVTEILAGAALPVVLLCIGANLRIDAMKASKAPIILSIIGKMMVFPFMIVVLAQFFGLSELETWIALLFGAAPSAPSSYSLARQLGGDAALMAAILFIQTAIAILTMPLTVWLAQSLLG